MSALSSAMGQFGGGQPAGGGQAGAGGTKGQQYGLNTDQGFGSTYGGTYQTYDPQLAANMTLGQQGFNNQGQLAQQQYGFQTGLAAQQGQIAQGLQAGQLASANLASERQLQGVQTQAAASELAPKLAMQRFQQVFPFLSKALTSQSLPSASGTATGTQPYISAAPVYSQQQIQQQVNTGRANNDQATAGQIRQTDAGLAGRGMGSGSPLAQALNSMAQNQNLATNTANQTTTQMNAANMNAQQVLQGQTAQEQQYASRQQEQISRQGIQAGSLNALLSALAGMS